MPRRTRTGRSLLAGLGLAALLAPGAPGAGAQAPVALLVGPPGTAGAQFASIHDAVAHAHAGDWVLVAPGDYHEKGTGEAGVLITTPGIHVRGMDRNRVVVDGTNAGGTAPCTPDPAVQDLQPAGRNGIEVVKVDGTSIDNLTVCNFLASAGGHNGNQLWWNGGDGSGQIGLHAFRGSYLTATSTFYKDPGSAMAQYGIFASNEGGPGTIDNSFASNMGDSDFYVGACPDCDVVLSHVHARNSSLGYSGTNAGGRLIIEDSEWDDNKVGIAPNSLNNDDRPSPQNGACPGGAGPPPGAHNCTVLRRNYVHDNNNPDAPASGISGEAPVGTGIELVGTHNDSLIGNRVENNSSWGIVAHDFPDTETPPAEANCEGGVPGPGVCLFQSTNNEVIGNQLAHNGASGNPSNGDLADESTGVPGNCFHGNVANAGTLITDPPGMQSLPCPQLGDEVVLSAQLVCASQALGDCPGLPEATYPRTNGDAAVRAGMVLPAPQPSMPDPCAGTPPNVYCGTASAGAAAAAQPAVRAAPVLPATGGGGVPMPAALAAVSVGGLALARRPRRR